MPVPLSPPPLQTPALQIEKHPVTEELTASWTPQWQAWLVQLQTVLNQLVKP